MKRSFSDLLILGCLILAGCSRSPVAGGREAEVRALREGEVAAFVKDWGGQDADRMAAHFTEDGNLMIPNSPTMTGRAAIAGGMREALADPHWSLALQPVAVEVAKSGDLGYSRGSYVLTATDPVSKKAVTEKGRFMVIFRKGADGAWRAEEEITNAEAPAGP